MGRIEKTVFISYGGEYNNEHRNNFSLTKPLER